MRFNNALMPEGRITADSQAEFDQLQKKLVPLWKSIERLNQDPQTIVVVPSMSIDAIGSGAVMQAYEERFLFLLLLLTQRTARKNWRCGSASRCTVPIQNFSRWAQRAAAGKSSWKKTFRILWATRISEAKRI